MAKTDTAGTNFKARERVTITRGIRGVPEGTSGLVKVASGLTWARYWIQFDNGEWVGSVSGTDIVREKDWESFKVRRAEEALRPKVEDQPVVATGSDVPAEGGAPVANSKVPAHLLERSQNARARKATSAEVTE